MPFEQELSEALAVAQAVSEYIRREYETFTPIPNAPASISTHVDRDSQEIILRHLRAKFPNDHLVAEEATPTLAEAPKVAPRSWIVDPIDGTRGFAMKNGEFSVMIGLTVDRAPVVGVVLEPVLHRITYAAKGGGCWVQIGEGKPERCLVTTCRELAQAVMIQSRSRPGSGPKPLVRTLGPNRVIETYSAGIKLAAVARGEAELYVNDYHGFHDWDICAGHILVEEAGGRVTLFNGEAVTYGSPKAVQRRGMIASNRLLHDEVVRRLGAHGG